MLDVHVTGGAGQRSLTGAFHLDSMAMGQVQNIVAHFALDLGALSILVHICDVHYFIRGLGILPFELAMPPRYCGVQSIVGCVERGLGNLFTD